MIGLGLTLGFTTLISAGAAAPAAPENLLLETGDVLLLETGDNLLLE